MENKPFIDDNIFITMVYDIYTDGWSSATFGGVSCAIQ
jgi:hypothetical protein